MFSSGRVWFIVSFFFSTPKSKKSLQITKSLYLLRFQIFEFIKMAGNIHPVLNFGVTPKDEFCRCPYNKSHLVLKPRLSQHLVKCRGAYEKECQRKRVQPSILVCRWNTNHHFDSSVLKQHESECPDRVGALEQAVRYNDPAFKLPGPLVTPAVANFSSSIAEENWEPIVFSEVRMKIPESTLDEDVRNKEAGAVAPKVLRPAYDPAMKLATEPVIINPQGLTRSERKQYRTEEGKRWREQNLMERVLNPDLETIEREMQEKAYLNALVQSFDVDEPVERPKPSAKESQIDVQSAEVAPGQQAVTSGDSNEHKHPAIVREVENGESVKNNQSLESGDIGADNSQSEKFDKGDEVDSDDEDVEYSFPEEASSSDENDDDELL